jgi:hypothetical protein
MRSAAKIKARRGSALSMIIIVSVIITGLVMTMAVTGGTQAHVTRNITRTDQAFYAAEAGAQRVAWYAKNKKLDLITSPLTGTINGYTYSTSWSSISSKAIRITSTGSLGNASATVYMTAIPPLTMPFTFASGGDFDSKNVDITGDVQTGGSYSSGGNGSIEGDLIYAVAAVNINTVSGTKAKSAYAALDLVEIGATLQAAAGQTLVGNQAGKNFNFNALSGTNKVIVVDGNVTNASFTGAGTLYVKGTFSGGSIGTSTARVNIVATGDITTSINSTIHGSLYSGGGWYRGKMDLYGLVYVTGISPANAGASTMTQSEPPWFDPRAANPSPLLVLTNFAGPNP